MLTLWARFSELNIVFELGVHGLTKADSVILQYNLLLTHTSWFSKANVILSIKCCEWLNRLLQKYKKWKNTKNN